MKKSKSRKILLWLLVLISVVVLLWGVLPFEQLTETWSIPPADLQLPAPGGSLLLKGLI